MAPTTAVRAAAQLPYVQPMLATLGTLPPERQDSAFGYEMKWDGIRAIAYVSAGRLRLVSRNDKDITVAYPELTTVPEAVAGRAAVLDGEIVTMDPAGRTSFPLLQRRMHVRDPRRIKVLMAQVPVSFFVFDLLWLDGTDLTGRTYAARRADLAALEVSGPRWATPPHWTGGGRDALQTSQNLGGEGILAKRLSSPYLPGRRSPDWIKVKNLRTQEVVLGGWQPGEGRRGGGIGSLLLGVPDPGGGLTYVGHVGTGFTQATLDDLAARLGPLAASTNPFTTPIPARHVRGARWLRPELVGEVAYGDQTPDGMLRHASWRGLRQDKIPADVNRE